MVPLKETFGEGWVEMDEDDEEHSEASNYESASSETALDANGCFVSADKETNKPCEVENIMFKESSTQSIQFQNFGKSEEGTLLSVRWLKVSEDNESKCNWEGEGLEEAGGNVQSMENEQFMMEDIATLSKTLEESSKLCLGGWAKGSKRRTLALKRVMSESSFMQGQVMVSKRDCLQEGMAKAKPITEGAEKLIACIPPPPLKTHLDTKAVGPQHTTLEMHPKSSASKAYFMPVNMHQLALETNQHSPKTPVEANIDDTVPLMAPTASHAHRQAGVSCAFNEFGKHVERPRGSTKTHLKTADMAETPSKAFDELRTEGKAPNMIPSKEQEVARGKMKTLVGGLQREEEIGRMQANPGHLDVEEVECECCGLGEECTRGYVEHVKGIFSGHWVCGLCGEATREERHRLGKGVPMEEAVYIHMSFCKQFSSMKKAGGPDSPGVAHTVCHLLSRHLGGATSPHQASTRPSLSRTSSCLPSFSHEGQPITPKSGSRVSQSPCSS